MTDVSLYVTGTAANGRLNRVIPVVALLGSIILAANASVFLHELGHAIGGWVYGGKVERFDIHPFAASGVQFRFLPEAGQFLMTAGGFLFGGLLALIPALAVLKWKSIWSLPLLLLGAFGGVWDGCYLVLGTIMREGDPAELQRLGLSPGLLIGWGGMMIVCGGLIGLLSLPRMGLAPDDGFGKRLALFTGGLMPYAAAFVVYELVTNPKHRLVGSTLAWLCVTLAIVPLAACGTRWVHPYLGRFIDVRPVNIKTTPALILFAAALVLIIAEALVYMY